MAGNVRQLIDVNSLEKYLSSHVPAISLPIEVRQFGYGQSNPTYQLTGSDGRKFVMRKKPPGKLLSKTAHRVDREYRIIHALENTDVPVPKAYCLCEDDNVVGTAFYIMEFLDGRIFEDASFPGVTSTERTALWKDAIQTLAKFHRVDPFSVGLEKYGKPRGFYNRQLTTFKTISDAQAKTKDIETNKTVGQPPHFRDTMAFLSERDSQPTDRTCFVHGDYKIDNLVFHRTESKVIGILDWEMSTIGHPLSDVANLLMPYTSVALKNASVLGRSSLSFREGIKEGLPSKSDLLRWYSEVSGWDPSPDIAWGEAFGLFRGSIIMQGIAARYAVRQASSAKAKEHGALMKPFGESAWELFHY